MKGGSQNDSTAEKPLGATALAISSALDTNIALQAEIKRRLLEVRRLRVQNRQHAAQVTKSLSFCWSAEPYHQLIEQSADADGNGTLINEGMTAQNKSNPNPLLDFNPTKRWTRRFFIDDSGLTPNLILGEDASEQPPDSMNDKDECTDDLQLQSAWTKAGISNLQRMVTETLQKSHRTNNDNASPAEDGNITFSVQWDNKSFFEEVASSMPSRTAEDCHAAYFTFADPDIVTTKFSKQESLFILSMARELGEDDGGRVDWYELTSRLNAKFYTKPQRRTPWQCFKHFRSNLKKDTNPPWTVEEDELLLKYIAAHGPQFAFGGEALTQASQNLFPLREPKLVYQRAHNTLVNPNNIQDRWDEDEEKKLALLMRSYCDEPNPIRVAASTDHFPYRAQVRVTSKWTRSLDPAVSTLPFSAEEDRKLLAAVKEKGFDSSSGQMAEIVKMFPNRSRENLKTRWTELAQEHDIASQVHSHLVEKNFRKKGLLGNDGDGLLSTDDFVVRKKKRKAFN